MNSERHGEQRERQPRARAPAAPATLDDREFLDEDRLAGAVARVLARRARSAQAAAVGAVPGKPAFHPDLIADAHIGHAVANARIDLWQANSVGRYMHPGDTSDLPLDPDFQGSAILTTDAEGNYRLRTILPGIYPAGDSVRPRHIHWDVTTRTARMTTQMYFPGEKENSLEKILDTDNRVATVARPLDGDVTAYRWDVIVPFG